MFDLFLRTTDSVFSSRALVASSRINTGFLPSSPHSILRKSGILLFSCVILTFIKPLSFRKHYEYCLDSFNKLISIIISNRRRFVYRFVHRAARCSKKQKPRRNSRSLTAFTFISLAKSPFCAQPLSRAFRFASSRIELSLFQPFAPSAPAPCGRRGAPL